MDVVVVVVVVVVLMVVEVVIVVSEIVMMMMMTHSHKWFSTSLLLWSYWRFVQGSEISSPADIVIEVNETQRTLATTSENDPFYRKTDRPI